MSKNKFDVIIVGNGFAGNILGAELSRSGLKVVILERKRQADHDTRCGNVIQGDLFKKNRLKLPDFLMPIPFQNIEELFLEKNSILKKRGSNPKQNNLYAFTRKDLDSYLEKASKDAGVFLLEDFCVDEVDVKLKGPASVRSSDHIIRGEVVVLASGTEEQLLRSNGFIPYKQSEMIYFAVQQELRGRSVDQTPKLIQVMNFPGYPDAAGSLLFFKNNLIITIFQPIKSSLLSDRKFCSDELVNVLRKNCLLPETAQYDSVTDWRTKIISPSPFPLRRLYGDRVLLVGDAALPSGGSLSPGSGFEWAGQTALEAAKIIPALIKNPTRFYLRSYAERIHKLYK